MRKLFLIAFLLTASASLSLAAVGRGITISGVLPSTSTYGGPTWTAHLAPSATISYPNGASLSVMFVTNYTVPDGAAEMLKVDTTGTKLMQSSSYDDSKVRLTVSGIDSLANYQRVLQSLYYVNTKTAPKTGVRDIEVEAFYGNVGSNAAVCKLSVQVDPSLAGSTGTKSQYSTNINPGGNGPNTVTNYNFANNPTQGQMSQMLNGTSSSNLTPYVDLSGGNGGPNFNVGTTYGGVTRWAHLAPNAVVTYSGANVASATIALTNRPDLGSEYLGFDNAFNPSSYGLVSNGYSYATGQLTVTGSAAPSVYQRMLRSLIYVDTKTNPTGGERTMTIQLSGGGVLVSNRPYSTVMVAKDPSLLFTPGNTLTQQPKPIGNITQQQFNSITNNTLTQTQAPYVNLPGDSTGPNWATWNYAGPTYYTHIAPNGTIAYSGQLTRMIITLKERPDGSNEYLQLQSGDLGQSVPAAYKSVPYPPAGGPASQGYNPGTGQFIFTGAADPSVYQAILRKIVYINNNPNPTTFTRHITVSVADRALASNVATFSLQVITPPPPTTGVPTRTTITAPSITDGSTAWVTVSVSASGGNATKGISTSASTSIGSYPTGSVSLSVDGGAPFPIGALNSQGTVTYPLPPTGGPGDYKLLATYIPTGNFLSSSARGDLLVTFRGGLKVPTRTSISAASITDGSMALVTVSVTSLSLLAIKGIAGVPSTSIGSAPTGSVTLAVDGGSPFSIGTLNSQGTVTYSLPPSGGPGDYKVLATYIPTGNFLASSASGDLIVTPRASGVPTRTTISAPSITDGSTALITVSVTSLGILTGVPTGSVTLSVNGGPAFSIGVLNALGMATYPYSPTGGPGIYRLIANYIPTGRFLRSGVTGQFLVIRPVIQRIFHLHQGDDLQNAIRNARPGDTIYLDAGATFEPDIRRTGPSIFLPAQPSNSPPITIASNSLAALPPVGGRVSPLDRGNMPKIVATTANNPAIATYAAANNYRLIGLEILPGTKNLPVDQTALVALGSGDQTSTSEVPYDLILDRCYIHAWPTQPAQRGIALNSKSTTITGCYISDFHLVGNEAQAILGWNGPGPYTITNNYLEGAGQSILFGGTKANLQGVIPSDIRIENNLFSKPLNWNPWHLSYDGIQWKVKNLLEFKNAQFVTVHHNVFRNSWVAAQEGMGLLVNASGYGSPPWETVDHVTISNNVFQNTMSGIFVGVANDAPPKQAPSNIIISNNLLTNLNWRYGGGQANGVQPYAFQVYGSTIAIEHNTAIPDQKGSHLYTVNGRNLAALAFGANMAGTNYAFLRKNIYQWGYDDPQFPSMNFINVDNVVVGAQIYGFSNLGRNYAAPDWPSVGFVAYGTNYRLAPTSPFKNSGTGGDRSDPGANIDLLPPVP